jgi:hypothetical protein
LPRPPRSPGGSVFADADVVFEALVGGVERFPDGHRQIGAGLTIDGDLGVRHADRDPNPEPALLNLGSGWIHSDPTLLDPLEEVSELLGPVLDVLGQMIVQQMRVVDDLQSNGHRDLLPGFPWAFPEGRADLKISHGAKQSRNSGAAKAISAEARCGGFRI